MADKQKDSKIMAMLEKRGILKRDGGDTKDKVGGSEKGYNPDIRPIFEKAGEPGEPVTIKTAPKQPIPGYPTPIMPDNKNADIPAKNVPVVDIPEPPPPPDLSSVPVPPPPPPPPAEPEIVYEPVPEIPVAFEPVPEIPVAFEPLTEMPAYEPTPDTVPVPETVPKYEQTPETDVPEPEPWPPAETAPVLQPPPETIYEPVPEIPYPYDPQPSPAYEPAPYEPQPIPEPSVYAQTAAGYEETLAAYTETSAHTAQQPATFENQRVYGSEEKPREADNMDTLQREAQMQPENYTDRYMSIDDLYNALSLQSKKTDTIYLIEEYIQSLPGTLPDSQRREIIGKLLASSGFDFDLLMGDGVLRVKMLREYAERFARHTDDYIAARQSELDELEKQIEITRRHIANRKELHKKQFLTIETEAQRLKEILTFISG